jgi:hypothetical protein
MMRWIPLSCVWLVTGALFASAQSQTCDGRTERRLDQEYYLALTDRVYVYVPDIPSTGSSGWQAFRLLILTGNYRKPFLLQSAPLKERDFATFLRSRSDLRQAFISIPAGTVRLATGTATLGSARVQDGERTGNVTIRVTRVVPMRGGTDNLFLICSVSR